MHKGSRIENQPYMLEIKKVIKPLYFAEIEKAIQDEDEDLIQNLLHKYLRKKEALQIFPKILFALRQQKRGKPKLVQQKGWSKPRILSYLREKLQTYQYQEVWKCIQDGNYDLCNTLLNDLLRFEEAEEIMPHIQKLIKRNLQNSDQINNKINQSIFIQKEKQSSIQKQQPTDISKKINQKAIKQSLFEKQLNPENKNRMVLQIKNPINEITKSQAYIKQKAKRQLLLEIQTQIQNEDLYTEFNKFLHKGKLRKAQELLKSILGKKSTQKFMKKLKQIFVQKINQPLQNSIFLHKTQDNIRFFQIQTQQILQIPEDDIINILIVGMTGVGKSTYLNAIVNYFLDVDIQDDFRYIVSRDMFKNFSGKSSTNKVNIYGLPKQGQMKKAVRLIDIPGLGDTGGIQKDKEHLKMIRQRIQQTVPFINQIIYVFKASDTRITKQTEYVIGQIMGMFAKDVQQNITFVLTFADNDEPRVLAPLRNSFGNIIQQISKVNKQWYIKVNNSALFKKIDLSNHVDVCFYTMGHKCLQNISKSMFNSTKVSTKNTVSVMTYREQLEQSIKALDQIIRANVQKQQNVKNIIKDITTSLQKKDKLNYKYKVKQQTIAQKDTQKNVTSCLNCKFPCHKSCAYGSSVQKQKCWAMEKGFCKICPDKCSWKAHINSHKIISRVFVQIQKTDLQLFKMYNTQAKNIQTKQQLLLDLITQYSVNIVNIKQYCDQLKKKNQQLSLLQLRKINHATVIQYIQILIDNENNTRKQGYTERIKQYEQLKRQEQRLDSLLTENQNKQLNQFENIIKNRIKSLVPNKQLADKLIDTVLKNYEQIKIAKKDMKMIKDQQMSSIIPSEIQPQQKVVVQVQVPKQKQKQKAVQVPKIVVIPKNQKNVKQSDKNKKS